MGQDEIDSVEGDAPVTKKVQQLNDQSSYDNKINSRNKVDFTAEQEKKLRRKIDRYVIPTVAVIYLFCFIDRANIGNARLAGLETSLGMSGYDYNVLLTSFYVAYIIFELPSNLLCKKVGPGKW